MNKMYDKEKYLLLKNEIFSEEKEFQRHYDLILQLKPLITFKNKNILDIGCGNSKFIILCSLIEKAKNCIGIDSADGKGSNKNILDRANKDIESLGINNIRIIRKDIFGYDSFGKKFDIITANFSLHHIINSNSNLLKDPVNKQNISVLFNKIYKLLKYDGTFIIKEISNIGLAKSWKFYGKIIGTKNRDWKSKHNPKEYVRILKNCNFNSIRVKYAVPYILRKFGFNKFDILLSNQVANFFFSSTFLIFAKKI